ncbi:hypothetical protein RFI_11486 [Reticulomyxa filosa]|uniref:Uncharacterized protein n=1 Tax=Reticulomyxa filosa TaxID=46433 RepID=X6N7I1_RETFI|nr:hypothetical protein RFI_14955 [Reticulomyxa filosa]ETO25652.1 hypothetical protein RFI_11486 [Reticulomyxa filosa]|eukprot:ETO22245.1 hypothetical protein RFI_14955 [Reticulomyxa filosa]
MVDKSLEKEMQKIRKMEDQTKLLNKTKEDNEDQINVYMDGLIELINENRRCLIQRWNDMIDLKIKQLQGNRQALCNVTVILFIYLYFVFVISTQT